MEQPIHVHFTEDEKVSQRDEDDDLQTETVKEKLKTGTDEGTHVDHFGKPAETVSSTSSGNSVSLT